MPQRIYPDHLSRSRSACRALSRNINLNRRSAFPNLNKVWVQSRRKNYDNACIILSTARTRVCFSVQKIITCCWYFWQAENCADFSLILPLFVAPNSFHFSCNSTFTTQRSGSLLWFPVFPSSLFLSIDQQQFFPSMTAESHRKEPFRFFAHL